MVCLASCDKTRPGQLMAAARLNIPTLLVGGDYQPSGDDNGESVDIEDSSQVRRPGHRRADESELGEMSRWPTGPGVCAGMATANTMHLAAEALGMACRVPPPCAPMGRKMFAPPAARARTSWRWCSWRDISSPPDPDPEGAFRNAAAVVLAVSAARSTP